MRLKASFTIESSYVMAVILFGLASAILFAHRERSQIIAEYVVHQAAEEGSHLEEIYEKRVSIEKVFRQEQVSTLGWWTSCQKHL